MCHVCTSVTPREPQVWLGKDKAFTYDNVFDMPSNQEDVYDTCVKPLVEGCFDGYNATVLAYGQTGSGKTYTMGTGFDIALGVQERGIIPRAVEHLFDGIVRRQKEAREKGEIPPEFKVNAQFMELYNEEIFDLLDPARELDERGKKTHIKIHEDARGGIYTVGVTTRTVMSVEETLQCLKVGALSRTTASTQMNAQSSRSHAIFTLHIKQQRIVKLKNGGHMVIEDLEEDEGVDGVDEPLNEFETLTAKFHFVDLAGSERLKRTGATGERAKEGISINCGLVISIDKPYIETLANMYREAKAKVKIYDDTPEFPTTKGIRPGDSISPKLFTATLENVFRKIDWRNKAVNKSFALFLFSRTLMIACVSPSDRDFMETLNTLKYANRAKNIKNRVMINQDKTSQTIGALRREIQMLQLELMEYKQGKRIVGEDGTEQINDMFHENTMLQTENNNLRTRIKALQETVERLTIRNTQLLAEKASGSWITSDAESKSDITEMIQNYLKEIEELRARLMESEEVCAQLRKQVQRSYSRLSLSPSSTAVAVTGHYDIRMDTESPSVYELIEEAKRDVRKMKKKTKTLKENIDKEGKEQEHEEDNKQDDASQKTEDDAMETSITEKNLDKSAENQSEEKVKKVKEDFEKKLNLLQKELKKMQTAKKEHAKLMKNQVQYERQLRQLKQEVTDMKQAKVRLMNKMKEEAQRHKTSEQLRNREIAQLKKESRKRENQIRTLEAEKRMKENVLRRKQEEVAALRRMSKPMSDKVAGRLPASKRHEKHTVIEQHYYDVHKSYSILHIINFQINKLVLNKQSIYNVERDMERWLHEREKLSHCLDRLMKKKDRALLEKKDEASLRDLEDQVENLKANIDYIQENISECQSSIVQMEETKDDMDGLDVNNLISNMQLEECKYLLEKLLHMSINQSFQVTQKDTNIKELEVKLKQVIESNSVQQQLLQHVLHQANEDLYNFVMTTVDHEQAESMASSRSTSPIDTSSAADSLPPTATDVTNRRDKARKKAATPEDLLFAGRTQSKSLMSPSPVITTPIEEKSMIEFHTPIRQTIEGPRVKSLSSSLKELSTKSKLETSPSLRRKAREKVFGQDTSPSLLRKHTGFFTPPSISRQNSMARKKAATPEDLLFAGRTQSKSLMSPSPVITTPIEEKSMIEFHTPIRQTIEGPRVKSLSSSLKINLSRGYILPITGRVVQAKHSPLVCTHIAEGHGKAVLSVTATDDVLFSSSKDRTVKIWDLHTGQEIQSLAGHPNNVITVKYCEYTRLAFSVSTAYVKVWDVRENPSKCIKTLCSSGLTNNGPVVTNTSSRTIQLPQGETQINDIALNHYGTTLFTAAGNIVRFWDLRMFHSIGKLSGGHQSAVMCLAVDELGVDNNLVITGSKDHYIKVFEVMEGVGGIHTPRMNLEPPHYDGIQSLAIKGDYLFSGSRDMCIKKWDLANRCLVQSLNQAHKDWICSMSFLPSGNALLSSCRGGYVKLWASDSCHLLGEIRAHNAPINSLATNSSSIFTASKTGGTMSGSFQTKTCVTPG
ncbi:kinesin-like protein KIF21B [Centruroides sculpturatus]|uniref:kinesin-like protein KIF21B n=1 Tax=Centruroides sculpturatus TaxID=218467 RepID=UPI000C6CC28E|nr:kinesin-like protein KIF21B [Centruroides sculpturatus]